MDNFREWLSDNLRYFMLGFGIIAVLLLLFFGIRFIADTFENKEDDQQVTEQQEEEKEDTSEQEKVEITPTEEPQVTEEPEKSNALEKNAYPTVNALMNKYFEALGNKDVTALKTLVDNLSAEDEEAIQNNQYIDAYSSVESYTKPGVKEGSYVVFACFGHKYKSYIDILPGMSYLYVDTREDGSLYIVSNPTQEQQQCINDALHAEDTQSLLQEQQKAYEEALHSAPALAEYLSQLGVSE